MRAVNRSTQVSARGACRDGACTIYKKLHRARPAKTAIPTITDNNAPEKSKYRTSGAETGTIEIQTVFRTRLIHTSHVDEQGTGNKEQKVKGQEHITNLRW